MCIPTWCDASWGWGVAGLARSVEGSWRRRTRPEPLLALPKRLLLVDWLPPCKTLSGRVSLKRALLVAKNLMGRHLLSCYVG